MNSSNRYGIESMARDRQAEVDRLLRQSAELSKLQPDRPHRRITVNRVAVGATALSVLGTLVFVAIAHVR